MLFKTACEDCTEVVSFAGLAGGIFGSQTVPRAEAAGVVNALRLIPCGGDVDIEVDNSGTIAQFFSESLSSCSTASFTL